MARDAGRVTGRDAGRTRTGRLPRAQRRQRRRGARGPAAAAVHVQTLPLHVLQLPGAHETHQQVSSHREPAGDAAADDRATVKRAPDPDIRHLIYKVIDDYGTLYVVKLD